MERSAWALMAATIAGLACPQNIAMSEALPASLVPSNATVPTWTMPAGAHSFSDSTRKPASACSWRARKRAMVTSRINQARWPWGCHAVEGRDNL